MAPLAPPGNVPEPVAPHGGTALPHHTDAPELDFGPDLPAAPPRRQRPAYWAQACQHLLQHDRVMRRLIPRYPDVGQRPRDEAFATLARSVVGQQVSVAAARTVWQRLLQHLPALQPADWLALPPEGQRALGLSARKAGCLTDIAQRLADGTLRPRAWPGMDDDAIAQQLMAVRGVGRWRADMVLLFHLRRPNVLPLDDAGLLQGISLNYFSGEPVTRHEAREVARAWAPYCSVATWYIWRSLEPSPTAV